MGALLAFQQTQAVVNCYNCGITFSVPQDFQLSRRDDHKNFYCPNGHEQAYLGKSEAEKLREQLAMRDRQLAAESERAATNFRLREKAEAEARKLKKRISGGACPCCKRSFVALAKHIKTKHPEFAKETKR